MVAAWRASFILASGMRRLGPEPSVFDRLELDPEASLAELTEALRDLAQSADPAERDMARRAFERLTERPEAHFLELVRAVPREPPVRAAPLPKLPPVALTLDDLVPIRASDALDPPTAEELALEEDP
jgi:hypothetical protein